MDFIEEHKKIQIKEHYDVCVVGGGIAGVASALAARRAGATVCLLESGFMLGGLATAGLVTIYLPLCDGLGRQLSFGLAEELLNSAVQYGAEVPVPEVWTSDSDMNHRKGKRYSAQYNANIFAIVMEKMLLSEGVSIHYGCLLCDVYMNSQARIGAVITEGRNGRIAYSADSFVDATGEARLCELAGETIRSFIAGNYMAGWYYESDNGKVLLNMLMSGEVFRQDKEEDAETSYIIKSHHMIWDDFIKKGKEKPGHMISAMASIPQIRKKKCLAGVYCMDETEEKKWFEDSIGMAADWRNDCEGRAFEIPFSILHGRKVENLITAGRCVSVTDSMWEITRVIPTCALTGQAAGAAAARYKNIMKTDVADLQLYLRNCGVKLHLNEVGL